MSRQKKAALVEEYLGGSLSPEQRHEKDVGKYSRARRDTLAFSDFILQHKPDVATEILPESIAQGNSSPLARIVRQVLGCSRQLWFHAKQDGEHRLVGGITCKKSLWCLCCALRRSARLAKTYLPYFQALLEANPNLVPVLITWTVKHGPDLPAVFEHLRTVQRTMLTRRRDYFKNPSKYLRPSPLRFLHGGAGSYEFKRGRKSQEWNFHIHEVALIDRRDFVFTEENLPIRLKKGEQERDQQYKRVYVPKELVSLLAQELWLVSGDSFIVDVRGLYPREGYELLNGLSEAELAKPVYSPAEPDEETPDTPDTLFSGLCEAFKYSVKPDELSHEDWFEAATYLQRRRLFYSYGLLRNVKVPEDNSDDRDEDWKDQPFIEKVYTFFRRSSRFELTAVHLQEDAVFPPFGQSSKKGNSSRRKPVSERNLALRDSVLRFVEKINVGQDDCKLPF